MMISTKAGKSQIPQPRDHHHHVVNTQGSSSSSKRIVSPSPPSSSLLPTATSPRQFVSKPNFKPKSPYVKQLNHIDHQAVPSENVDSPRSDKSRSSSYGRLSSPAHEAHHIPKTHHHKSTILNPSKLKPLASSVPQSKKIKTTKNQHSHHGKKPTPVVQRISLLVDEEKKEKSDLPPPYIDQKNEDKIFLEEEARSLLIETKESLLIKHEYGGGDSEGKSKSALEESLTKSHFFPRKDHHAVHHPEHEYSEYTLPGDYYVAEIPSRDVEAEGEYIIEEAHSSEKEFLETADDVKINEQPITLNSARKLNIPRFAHELSHQKIFDRQSFGERRLSTGEILPTLADKITSSSTNKAYYFDILKELEQTPLSIRHDSQASYLINKADKVDQATFIILTQKLGNGYSQSLYRIFSKYVGSNEEYRTKMNFTKLLAFARDFGLLNDKFHKEELSLIFTKRCPNKTIDFPGFVDILFKIGKRTGDIHDHHDHEKNTSFQAYLDRFVLSQHHYILEKQLSPRFAPVSAFGKEYGPENEALRLLEGHDDLLKHVFTLYKSIDIQFSNKSVVTLKDFKSFCHDFQIVPALVSFTEVHEVFKRFQLNEKPILDFRGFVLSLCCIANIGYEKEHHKQKYDTYTKRLTRFFALLIGMNNRIANQLVANNIRKLKE